MFVDHEVVVVVGGVFDAPLNDGVGDETATDFKRHSIG